VVAKTKITSVVDGKKARSEHLDCKAALKLMNSWLPIIAKVKR
jgi:hypothetical protein